MSAQLREEDLLETENAPQLLNLREDAIGDLHRCLPVPCHAGAVPGSTLSAPGNAYSSALT